MAKEQLTIRIESNTKKAFAELCASKRPPVTQSAYIELLIKEELERHNSAPESQQSSSHKQ